jgi:hypothetical protein
MEDRPSWVQLRIHDCSVFVECPNFQVLLFACQGLLLISTNNEMKGIFKEELAWVYKLDTSKWHELLILPKSFFIELGMVISMSYNGTQFHRANYFVNSHL